MAAEKKTAQAKALDTIRAKRAHVEELLTGEPTPAARIELLIILSHYVKYHDSGKIEGVFSLDSSCSACDFCQRMQEAGKNDPALICGSCYTSNIWESARIAHEIPAAILSRVEFTADELRAVAIPPALLRINCDGEIINFTHATNVLRIAEEHPAVTVAIWTKRGDIVDEAIRKEGHKPENLIYGQSSPYINRPHASPSIYTDFVFTVYTPAGMEKALARGERECNGKKCKACGFSCYHTHGNGAPVYVAEILRKPTKTTSAQFADMIRKIDEKTL